MNQAEYEATIKRIVKEALWEGVSWTSREFAALNKAAIDEVSRTDYTRAVSSTAPRPRRA